LLLGCNDVFNILGCIGDGWINGDTIGLVFCGRFCTSGIGVVGGGGAII
jgi:hypothetical protein